jgi:DNA polymerase-1
MVALAVAPTAGPVAVVSEPERADLQQALAPIFQDLAVTKLGADLKAFRVALARRGIALAGGCVDLSLASYCLNPSRAGHDLVSLGEELLGLPRAAAREPAVAACEDAHAALALRPLLMEQLAAHDMEGLFRDLETPLAAVLAEMELTGIALDEPALRRQGQELDETLARLLAEIYELAGGEFNVGSPPQLREVLFDRLKLSTKGIRKGKTGLSTDVDVLTRLAAEHALPAKILEWRALAKLKTTYVDALPALIDPTSGRLHTSFNQTVAATGRLSSSDPNLQNIPIRRELGRDIRRGFVAQEGWKFLVADYSQIELRLLAHLSGDPAFVAAFRSGGDIHRQTAAVIFGVDVDDVTGEMRSRAKTINFATIYGQGANALARQLRIPHAEAKAFIETYFTRFGGVRAYLDSQVAYAREHGYVETIFHRRRYIPELRDRNFNIRAFGERVATNAPIQGSAADLIKVAMIRIHEALRSRGLRGQMLLQVHDELVLEAPPNEVDAVGGIVRGAMEGAADLSVPLVVDFGVGANWLEAKA